MRKQRGRFLDFHKLHVTVTFHSPLFLPQRHPAEPRRTDNAEAVPIPTQGLQSETAGKTVPAKWGQVQVDLQGHRTQTLSDDAERGAEEEAQGEDALGDRAGEHVAATGAGGAPRVSEKVQSVTGAGAHTPASLRSHQPPLHSAIQQKNQYQQ